MGFKWTEDELVDMDSAARGIAPLANALDLVTLSLFSWRDIPYLRSLVGLKGSLDQTEFHWEWELKA